jgi:hypothetical protein
LDLIVDNWEETVFGKLDGFSIGLLEIFEVMIVREE